MYLLKPYLLLHGLLLVNQLYLNLMNMKKNRNHALIKSTKHRQGSNLNTFTILVLIISKRQRIFCLLLASCKKKNDENFVEKGYMENRY